MIHPLFNKFFLIMLNFRRISFLQRSISFGINARRFRSARRSSQSSSIDEKHIITETKPVSLDNLSPVARQLLSKDPSYAVRFGGQLSENKKYLVRQHSRTTGRAENLFSQIPKDDLISITNEDEVDIPPACQGCVNIHRVSWLHCSRERRPWAAGSHPVLFLG